MQRLRNSTWRTTGRILKWSACATILLGYCRSGAADILAIDSFYNADTIAATAADSAGIGYRNDNNKISAAGLPAEPGRLFTAPDGLDFQFGPYSADNTVLLRLTDVPSANPRFFLPSSSILDVANGQYNQISFLYSAVGLTNPSTNGVVSVTYTDATVDSFVWDVIDSDGAGNNGLAAAGLTGQSLIRFNPAGGPFSGRTIWRQDVFIDISKTIDKVTFDTAGVLDANSAANDAEIGVYALSASVIDIPAQPTVPVEITAYANADTVATSNTDSAGLGYRATNDKFLATAGMPPGPDRIATGMKGSSYQFAPYDADNTILMGLTGGVRIGPPESLPTVIEVDLPNGKYDSIGLVHSAVGFNNGSGGLGLNTTNGKITVKYSDGSSEEFLWDLVDSDGNGGADGQGSTGLFKASLGRLSGTFTNFGARNLWEQIIEVDGSKTVDSMILSIADAVDGIALQDAEFGVYAISVAPAPIPEPSGAVLLVVGGLLGCARQIRRRVAKP